MVAPPWIFSLDGATPARARLGAELIAAGKIVSLGGISVRLEKSILEVAIYVDRSLSPIELRALRGNADRVLSEAAATWSIIGEIIQDTRLSLCCLAITGRVPSWSGAGWITPSSATHMHLLTSVLTRSGINPKTT